LDPGEQMAQAGENAAFAKYLRHADFQHLDGPHRTIWKYQSELFAAALMIFWLAAIHAARRVRLDHFNRR
jgi:hypothetical protein